jgi:hypothetical protein
MGSNSVLAYAFAAITVEGRPRVLSPITPPSRGQ